MDDQHTGGQAPSQLPRYPDSTPPDLAAGFPDPAAGAPNDQVKRRWRLKTGWLYPLAVLIVGVPWYLSAVLGQYRSYLDFFTPGGEWLALLVTGIIAIFLSIPLLIALFIASVIGILQMRRDHATGPNSMAEWEVRQQQQQAQHHWAVRQAQHEHDQQQWALQQQWELQQQAQQQQAQQIQQQHAGAPDEGGSAPRG